MHSPLPIVFYFLSQFYSSLQFELVQFCTPITNKTKLSQVFQGKKNVTSHQEEQSDMGVKQIYVSFCSKWPSSTNAIIQLGLSFYTG